MKIDRLIGILSILLQQEKVTAPYLAEKFEVSRRTINRDIEDICKAGIPLVTTQGKNGGIMIMEGYRIDRTVITSSEMRAILAGLRSLDSISGSRKYRQLMEKLCVSNAAAFEADDHILIDLSSWYKSTLAPKIETVQSAIDGRFMLTFEYYSPTGESVRTIEPYYLVFHWSSWYVWGYCLQRQDYRLFKLNRIVNLTETKESYAPRELPPLELDTEQMFPKKFQVKAVMEPEVKWRVIEEFGAECISELEDGRLLFRFGYSDKENLFGWILSMGDKVELLEPSEFRAELGLLAGRVKQKYESEEG